MDDDLDLKVSSEFSLWFSIPLKVKRRSIYMHSWTSTDNCLIRWCGVLVAIWSLWRPWCAKRLDEKVASKTIFLAIWQVATMTILCRGRHGDLKWRPWKSEEVATCAIKVAMATLSGDHALSALGRHLQGRSPWRPQVAITPDCFLWLSVAMALKWRPSSDLLSLWRILCRHGALVATFHVQVAKMPCFLHFHLNCFWNLIKPETLNFNTLNTGKCPRIKLKESEMGAKIIPILAWSNTPKPIFC